MSLLGLFKRRASAPVARERLQILLAHERSSHGQSDLLSSLRDEILAVSARGLAPCVYQSSGDTWC
jgi:cell division topological specificity factor